MQSRTMSAPPTCCAVLFPVRNPVLRTSGVKVFDCARATRPSVRRQSKLWMTCLCVGFIHPVKVRDGEVRLRHWQDRRDQQPPHTTINARLADNCSWPSIRPEFDLPAIAFLVDGVHEFLPGRVPALKDARVALSITTSLFQTGGRQSQKRGSFLPCQVLVDLGRGYLSRKGDRRITALFCEGYHVVVKQAKNSLFAC